MTPTLTPGGYLRRCRERLGKTPEEVALETETSPAICARDRAELLEAIEADLVPVSVGTGIALHRVLKFDPDVLDALIELYETRRGVPPGISRHGERHVEFVALRNLGEAA